MARTTRTTLSYQNTKDDAYIQSLPNGEIISFKARGESSGTEDHSILWGSKFNNPMFVFSSAPAL
jgi:serine/threonine-protein kinase/endoribonuclease IRE1